jgi:hypothetical protein
MDLSMYMDVDPSLTASEIASLVTGNTLPGTASLVQVDGKVKFRWTVTTS